MVLLSAILKYIYVSGFLPFFLPFVDSYDVVVVVIKLVILVVMVAEVLVVVGKVAAVAKTRSKFDI